MPSNIISTKILIPTTTSIRRKYPIQLFSPSKSKSNNFGELTIVDCHTYYLRKYCRRDFDRVIKHYEWYVDCCNELQYDFTKILVLPDWDWVGDFATHLNELWFKKIKTGNFLETNSSAYNKDLKYIGFAHGWSGEVRNKYDWIHIFSKKKLEVDSTFTTYDSQDLSDYDEFNCEFAKTFIQSLF